ncbi:MAG: carboxypeptidase-like regulatory domain-containing protein [Lewinellaceae bacterium]|nr:carboxypeptidase-like regulatory domain-containing protein [Lewinellaceae bacterium]
MKTILFAILLAFPMLGFGQTIFGTVTDAAGMPMKGVKVVAQGTTNGTLTDEKGTYSLKVPNGAAVTAIVFTYKEYKKPLEVKMKTGLMTDTRLFVTMDKKKKKRKFVLAN